jgi:uncharacterized protein (TIGR02145 family)
MPGWPSYNPQIHLPENFVEFVESNMASPATGDISNSWRFPDDIPICSKTVVVYCYNFRRFQAEAVHDHGHQLESIYKYVAEQQDGSYNLFVHDFSGWGEFYSSPPIGRAGDCHHPPNTTQDYDYLNMTLVESDIEDWSPEIGPKKSVNAATWGNLSYDWPQGYYFPALTESQWYIYWMQNMPGYLNEIPYYDDGYMSNWWQFTDNWDSCHALNLGLHASTLQYRPCPGVPAVTDPRNGKTYHTVKIGNQCWMQENMDIGTRITGSQNQLSNSIIEKYCQQDNEVNCSVYGGLYQWAEALQYYNGASNTTAWSTPPSGIVRGICPEGWHIPTLAEWTQLTDYLGGLSVAGGKMKEAGTTHWVSPNTGATNSSWFTALPGGSHWGPGGFYYFPTNALFWTATEGSATGAWYRILGYDWAGVSGWPDGGKIDGFAVRCLYDAVQANLNLQNITVPVSTYNCYNALQTITVAGGGTTFLVQEGGDAMLIAGEKILLEPGTKVDPYGHLWGYITTDNTYCYTKAPAFVAKESRQETTSEVGKEPSGSLTIKPNPASETILVEIPGHEDLREETIRIYTSSGRLVLEETFRGTSPFEIHIGRLPAGLYLARIRGGEKEWSSKIVKTQR